MDLLQILYQWLTPSTISALITILLLFKYTKKLLISPISRLPGPFYTSLSHLPTIYLDQISHRTPWTLELHKLYGPIVRLSPFEVSVATPELIKEVFVSSTGGGGGYPKAPFFNIFQHFGARNSFSSFGSEDHSWRRRLVGGLYTQTAVLRKEVVGGRLWKLVGDFLEGVERDGVGVSEVSKMGTSGKAVDLHSYSPLQGTGAHRSFVESSNESPDEVITYFKMKYENLEFLYILSRAFLRRIGNSLSLGTKGEIQKRKSRTRLNVRGSGKRDNLLEGDLFYGGTEIEDWGFKRFLDTKKSVEAGEEAGVVAEILARNVLEGEQKRDDNVQIEFPLRDDKGLRVFEGLEKRYYRDDGAASECMDQFLAGRDTTGDTLTYIIHLLSLPIHKTVQLALHTEIQSLNLPKSFSEPLTQDQLNTLIRAPYLDAVIKETLRIYLASTTALQRSVPTGSRTISHYFLPENTIIGATPMATNTASIFASLSSLDDIEQEKDINSWIPERWLPSLSTNQAEGKIEKEKLLEMEQRMWTFESGGRGCIGKHLAILEMKLLLAGVYGKHRTEIDDNSKIPIIYK